MLPAPMRVPSVASDDAEEFPYPRALALHELSAQLGSAYRYASAVLEPSLSQTSPLRQQLSEAQIKQRDALIQQVVSENRGASTALGEVTSCAWDRGMFFG